MTERVEKSGLAVSPELVDFIEKEALPGTGIDAAAFWDGLSAMASDLGPKNKRLERSGRWNVWADA